MPGPGGGGPGGGPGGFGGPGGPGGFGGPGGPGGFGGPGGPGGWGPGGWGPGGPGGWWGPGWGGPPPFMGGPPPPGPFGGPWFCWPFLCFLAFVIIASAGIAIIETMEGCEDDEKMDQTTCTEYDVGYAIGVGVVIILICCCCCSLCADPRPDGTPAERAHIMATEAPPPAVVYVADPSKVPATVYAGTTKV